MAIPATFDIAPAQSGALGALPVFDLGVAPYLPVQDLQRRIRVAVADGLQAGAILLLQHQAVITLGHRRAFSDVRDIALARNRGVEVEASERGGQATLHAPGQLVAYPIVPVPRHDLRRYVHDLEEVFMLLSADYGVTAHRREGHPGLYVQGDKIMSVGLRCHRWVASHGASYNVSIDLSLFDLIVSCGEPGLRQTSLEAVTGRLFPMDEVKSRWLESAKKVFHWELAPVRRLTYQQVEGALGLTPPAVPTAGFEPATPGSGGQCSIP